jgi:hypothetical protein
MKTKILLSYLTDALCKFWLNSDFQEDPEPSNGKKKQIILNIFQPSKNSIENPEKPTREAIK